MLLVSAQQMRELDDKVQKMGVPALILMENAGKALAYHSMIRLEEKRSSYAPESAGSLRHKGSIAILAGPGQNGGDGFCAARHLASWGYQVKVGFFGDEKRLPREASLNYAMLEGYPVEIYSANYMSPEMVMDKLGFPDLIIDALLGIGAGGDPRFPISLAVDWANSQGVPIVACDIPTGISADTGQVYTPCIKADLTVTMGFAKIGLFSYPGRMFAGDIIVENLGFPQNVVKMVADGEDELGDLGHFALEKVFAQAVCAREIQELLPRRRDDHHKGLSGHVTVIAGSVGMAGASVLTAKGALRAGAGTVTLLCPGKIYQVCASMAPEVMVVPCGDSAVFTPDPESIKMAKDHIDRSDAVAIGPGWGRGRSQTEFLKDILSIMSNTACVIDADALFALRELGGLPYIAGIDGEFVLTPHPGEMATLRDMSTQEVGRARTEVSRKAAMESRNVVCLKGAGTCTAGPEGEMLINTSGNSAMATAGSGDVLTGIIASLKAQGLSCLDSAVAGVFWHGIAGDIAYEEKGSFGIIAGDIVEHLPQARAFIERA